MSTEQCSKCEAPAEYGYRIQGDVVWFCADHRLSGNYADKRLIPIQEPAVEGEVLLPKREIAFQPIMRKVECMACGAEADATFHPTCNCNAGFRSKGQRAAEAIAQHPEKSDRAIAKEIGASRETVRTARSTQVTTDLSPEPERVGLDGKSYPATKPSTEPKQVDEDALVLKMMNGPVNQIRATLRKLSRPNLVKARRQILDAISDAMLNEPDEIAF